MTPVYQQSGAAAAFWILFGLFAAGEAVMRIRSRLHPVGTQAGAWSQVIVAASIVGGLLGGLGAANVGSTELHSGRWLMFIVGLVLMTFGIFVRQWSIVALGRYFTGDLRISAGQPVIEKGPYRWVRHPSYSGLIIFFSGFGLALTNASSLAILCIVPTTGLIPRIRFEERALVSSLGEPYRRYAAKRKRLLPGVW